jgi:hypothetical protein
MMKSTTPRLTLRLSSERGQADHGWLVSRHTFSFADYFDPQHMGFRSLRVINDDRVAPGGGFPTHPHRDMEIFSYVLAGKLQHKDSLGNGRVLGPGEVQLMGAGRGVRHSEYNPSPDEPAHFLQIWIEPHTRGLDPRYTEWKPAPGPNEPKTLIISPEGRKNSARIFQDADVFRLLPQAGEILNHEVRPHRGVWIHVARGRIAVNGVELTEGDAASTEEAGLLEITGGEGAEALLFDLA